MTKQRHSRREFIGLTGAGVAGAIGAQSLIGGSATAAAGAADTPDPDLVVLNAKVYTVEPQTPRAEAFAVKNGRFVAVGATADIRGLAGQSTQAIDARQM